MSSRIAFCATLLTLVVFTGLSYGQDWPGWRGPNRDGVVAETALPKQWPDDITRLWNVEVGTGHSSPVVVDEAVYIFARQDDREVVRRLDLDTGKVRWKNDYSAPYKMHSAARRHGKGPKSTPTVADGRLFTFGISGTLTCWETENGRRLWQQDFADDYPKTSPDFGVAASPLIIDKLCIVPVGGKDNGSLLALDVLTGMTSWKWDGDGPAYSSPVVATIDGRRQIITQSQSFCVALAADSGQLLWRIPYKTAYDQNSITPLVCGDTVVFSGVGQETIAVRPRRAEGQWQTDVLWRNKETSMYMSTPVRVGQRLLGMSDRRQGHFFLARLSDGQAIWTSQGRQAKNAAILTDGSTAVALTDRGELLVFNLVGLEPRQIALYKVADTPTWSHPVMQGESFLVKDESNLARWRFGQ